MYKITVTLWISNCHMPLEIHLEENQERKIDTPESLTVSLPVYLTQRNICSSVKPSRVFLPGAPHVV
jgi:hypothetical protein